MLTLSRTLSADEIRTRAEAITWWHGGIDLGHGIVTRGRVHPPTDLLPYVGLPDDLTGKTVVDIGAWDGFMSWECEKRNAARVVAVDSHAWDTANVALTHNPTGRAGFDLAHGALQSSVEPVVCEVLDLDPAQLGTYDIVLFLGVLYHMRHPLLALEKVAALARDLLIVETHADLTGVTLPAMRFYAGDELNNDASNWWGPNVACVRAMLLDVGFGRVSHVSTRGTRLVLHAWRERG